jgi:hypothetical protein
VSIIDMETRTVKTASPQGVPASGSFLRTATGMDYEPEYIAINHDDTKAFVGRKRPTELRSSILRPGCSQKSLASAPRTSTFLAMKSIPKTTMGSSWGYDANTTLYLIESEQSDDSSE